MTAPNKYHLLLLFDRPQEPSFFLKGDQKVRFIIPESYYTKEYQFLIKRPDILADLTKGAKEKILVKSVPVPDLKHILNIHRNDLFSNFIPRHINSADRLIDIFMDAKDVEELLSIALYVRDRVNAQLFNYAYSIALHSRADTKSLVLPSLVHFFPNHFIDDKKIVEAKRIIASTPEEYRKPIEMPMDYTATDLDIEHRVAYFREDIGVNLHHWQWHLSYPNSAHRNMQIAIKDRRGELFYYMHHQIVTRYNAERLSNKLQRVDRLINWDEVMKEAYFPKLRNDLGTGNWPGRVSNEDLRNIHRNGLDVDINDLKKWRDRITDIIDAKVVIDKEGKLIPLTEDKGIDILGDIIESSIFSPKRDFFGNLHNMGHVMIAAVHDPDHRHLEHLGVMGFNQIAMRDPLFYRWHAYLDDLFQTFKDSLPSYDDDQLNYPGITITKVETKIDNGPTDLLQTYWKKSTVNISGGLDFSPRGKLLIKFTHLDHSPFTYNISVKNDTGVDKIGTCRIFISPKRDESNEPWNFDAQRSMFIELDKFRVKLTPGTTEISRKSSESSVTIPFDQIFRDLTVPGLDSNTSPTEPNICGCGWPEYMLLPKGTPNGMPCDLFVMISNYDDDKVPELQNPASGDMEKCREAVSYCGSTDKYYPDRRAMGYPFDRPYPVDYLDEFLTSNMMVKDVAIQFQKRDA